jgi:RNA-directed DNA polymerase
LGPRPAQKKVDRLCSEISELTTGRKAWRDVEELMSRINRKLRGWSNYFRSGTVSQAYRNINSHTRYRVRQGLCVKFKERGQGKKRFSDQYLHQKLGLYQLERTSRQRFVGERV